MTEVDRTTKGLLQDTAWPNSGSDINDALCNCDDFVRCTVIRQCNVRSKVYYELQVVKITPSLLLLLFNRLIDDLIDDTMCYLTVKSEQDAKILQADLDKLTFWEQTWTMEFHPDKCEVISITRKRKPVLYEYTLHGHWSETETCRYCEVPGSTDSSRPALGQAHRLHYI